MEPHVNPEDSEFWALGALDGEQRQALEAHARGCAQCARELEAAQQRIVLLGLAAPPVAPPPALRESLLRQVRAERMRTVPQPAALPASRPRQLWLTPAFAVATIIFAGLSAWLWSRDRQDLDRIQGLQVRLSEAQSRTQDLMASSDAISNVLGAPGTVRVALASQPGGPAGRAGVLFNARFGYAVYVGELPPAAAGRSYQLWLVPSSGNPISLGVFSGSQPTIALTARVAPGLVPKAFAVTVEPEGGSPQPTGPKVLVGAAG
jgi:anti-sigma-K factor RskA